MGGGGASTRDINPGIQLVNLYKENKGKREFNSGFVIAREKNPFLDSTGEMERSTTEIYPTVNTMQYRCNNKATHLGIQR